MSEMFDIDIEVDGAFTEGVDILVLRSMIAELLAAEAVEAGTGLAVQISGDALLHELNRAHRGVDEPTDVLSFGAEEGEAFPVPEGEPRYLGDIAVSVEAVRRQAPAAGLAFEAELAHVILHGTLHLLGYDHETEADDAALRAREEGILGPEIHNGDRAHADDA
jgi:probable rRNA maturation factor